MNKYLNEFIQKQSIISFCKLAIVISLLALGDQTFAQRSRIAVVNIADSNIFYKHVGLAMFKDKTDTIYCQFNFKQYIDRELTRMLSSRYSVNVIPLPDNLAIPFGNISNSSDINNDVKAWIGSLKKQYDFVVLIETGEQDDILDIKKQKLRSCGLYTRGNTSQSWVAVYSTTRFTLIRTSNSEAVDYGWSGMDYLLPLSDFQFSRDNLLIDPEMLTLLKTGLIKLFDYKLQYFLTNSFLIPDDDYDNLKSVKTE